MQKKLWSREFVAIIGSGLFMAWAFYALLPTLPIYLIETLRISHRNVGLIMGAFFVSAILLRPFSGYLVDNYHRSRMLIGSLFLMTVAYGMYPLISAFSAILLLRLMQGLMWSICTSSSATIVADIVPTSRIGQGMGIYASSLPIGMTVGPAFGLACLKDQGPNGMFLAILCVSFLSVLGAFFARTSFRPATRTKFSFSSLLHKKALPISLCMFFIMITYTSVIVFVGVYASQKAFSNVATFFLCFSAAIFFSRLFAGRLFDRGHILWLILVGVTLTALGMLWLGCLKDPTHFPLAGAICGLGFGVLMPTCQTAINSLVKSSERGSANSTYLLSYDLGAGIGSLLIGFLSDTVPLGEIYVYTVFLVLLSACIFLLIALPHYRRTRQETAYSS